MNRKRADYSRIILASTSPYRRTLLARLRLAFAVAAPAFEEAKPGGMPAAALVKYNTLGKAKSVAEKHPDAGVIASDQLALCNDQVLGKPGSFEAACAQLQRLSGRYVDFLTGVALIAPGAEFYDLVPFRVYFRRLSPQDIKTYVQVEEPLDCAGSFKSEGLGICLVEKMEGSDPTALMGLPLITLSAWLQPLSRL